jgi:hypothetical protein
MQVLTLLYEHTHVGFSSKFLDMFIWHREKTDFGI